MTALHELTADELLAAFRAGAASPVEAVRACLARIEAVEPCVHAVITVCGERALAQARASERRWRDGTALALDGLPFGVKDTIWAAGMRTTCGSLAHADDIAAEDATVVARLRDAGGVLLAKLHTFEFAHHEQQEAFGITANPWDTTRTACGSSAGSAAAVAARELPFAIGTDNGGSIRVPAALCGVSGLKPTYGRISRHGVLPLAWSVEHVGPLARSARDLARVLAVTAGRDARDPSSADVVIDDYLGACGGDVRGMRLGVPRDWFFDVCDPDVERCVRAAIAELDEAGAELVEVRLPEIGRLDPPLISRTVILPEFAAIHDSDGDRWDRYTEGSRRGLHAGRQVPAVDYVRAQRLRHLVQLELAAALRGLDALLTPTAPAVAPLLADLRAVVGERSFPMTEVISRATSVFNLAGLPAATVPCGRTRDGLPVGLQIAAGPWEERRVLRVAAAFQQRTEHHRRAPAI